MFDLLSPVGGRLWYLGVFGLAALATFVSAIQANRIAHDGTRRGLVALLLTSGGWALSTVGYLATDIYLISVVFYQVGLFVGLSTVGAWLYFCSAYTGRSLHRDPTIRRAAIGVFLAVIVLKLTNSFHGLYFTTQAVSDPFPHLAVQNALFHWMTMGASYALATVGYFMLYERFRQVSHDTWPLLVLLGLTALPIVLDILGLIVPGLLEIAYEPIGVAVFAVGLMFVFFERFQTIRLAGASNDPVIVIDDSGRIRDFNQGATKLVPALDHRAVIGEPLEAVTPEFAAWIEGDDPIITVDWEGERRYFRLNEQSFSAAQSSVGCALIFSDETDREQYRKELERQNDRLDSFANMLSHDLRNPLNVAQGRLDIARDDHDNEHLEAASNALDRIETLIEDVLELAKRGRPVEDLERVGLESISGSAWKMVETDDAQLHVTGDCDLQADPDRLQQLFENLFRNAIEHAGRDVTVTVGPLADSGGFFVEDDGVGIPPEERDQVFESGYTTADDGTGFGLAIVEQIVTAHNWDIELADVAQGTRFEIRT